MKLCLTGNSLLVRRTLRTILRFEEFSLEPATLAFLVGHNGSGKSALMRCLCGFGPFKLKSEWRLEESSRFAYLDSEPLAGMEHWLTTGEVLQLFCRIERKEVEAKLAEAQALGIGEGILRSVREERGIHEISSGERQSLLALGAYFSHAELWALDECFSSLDPRQTGSVLKLFGEIMGRIVTDGGIILAATHDSSTFNKIGHAAVEAGLNIKLIGFKEGRCREMGGPVAFPVEPRSFEELYTSA